MLGKVRVEVEGTDGRVGVNVTPPDVSPDVLEHARSAVSDAIAQADALGWHEPAATLALLLVEQIADERAYQRVAQQRGYLPL